jgi:D-beta-D-heptose 7-phosphate kinase / D-beta-D-heptose 1-phosphate adenosyltransferase
LLRAVIQQARERQLPVIVDPSYTSDLAHYQGATILKPNRKEAARAAGFAIDTPQDAIRAAQQLQQRYEVESVLITLDRDGIVLVDREGVSEHFATHVRSVCDITAAGDMVLAVVGLCIACGVDLRETVQLANCAAGFQIERVGARSLSRGDLQREFHRRNHAVTDKQVTLDQMTALAASYRAENRRVVFTNGCFDLIHAGHTSYLQQAAALGDVLIVAINGDESIAAFKGSDRPLVPAFQRAALLSSLACVDHLLIFDDLTPHRLLRAIRPDVLVKGGTYTTDEVVGREIVAEYGGRVVVTEAMDGLSTTNLIAQVRSLPPPATRRARFELSEH